MHSYHIMKYNLRRRENEEKMMIMMTMMRRYSYTRDGKGAKS